MSDDLDSGSHVQAATAFPASTFAGIDRSGPVPLYFQLAERIEAAIRSGELPAGARLENEIGLSERIGISRPTIRRAMQRLVDQGLLVRRRGIGTQVVFGPISRKVELTSLHRALEASGRHATTSVLVREMIVPDPAVADGLAVSPDERVLHLVRVRSSDGVPMAVMENYLPAEFESITASELTEHGLYELLELRGATLRVAKQRIAARRANPDEVRELQLHVHDPVLTIESTAYDSTGQAVELARHSFRTDLYSFETTVVA